MSPLPPAPRRGLLLVLCGALFLDALDVSMKGVALPAIRTGLGMSEATLPWVVSGYVLGFGGFLLLGGRAADLLGRRRMFLWSLAVFLVASALGGLADDPATLVAARFATGVSAAFTAPAGLSIITTTYPDGPARHRALSVYNATGASGFALGLVAGGLLTGVSWRWVFFVPVLMGALTLAGGLALIPRDGAAGPRRGFDVAGAVLVTAGMSALVLALTERSWTALAAAVVLLAAFLAVERRSAAPLVRPRLLLSGPVVRANLGAMALLGGWISTLFVVTLSLQDQRGWSALETGLAVSPSGILVALLAPRLAPPLVARFGAPRVILAGLLAEAAAYGLLLAAGPDASYPLALLPVFLLVGVAFTLAYGPLTMAATDGVPAAEQGVAGGLVNTSFQIGPALALALTGALVERSGLRAAVLVPLCVVLAGAAVTALGLRRRTPAAPAGAGEAAPAAGHAR
ncbi:MFS transporter [Actinomadura kijaniata]|uniref:MFS transporter n=1 Tax=Actinomadura kijaniata TaxID=46161 RepID=UPI003F1CA5B8